jgi:SAM-dependent methyltransferase
MGQTSEYVLGTSEGERGRLLRQGEIQRPEAEKLMSRIGVSEGWHAIDVGCGPLGVLDILAERVGATGSVTGVDREQRMLEMATVSLAERGIGGVKLVRADAADTRFDPDTFDLTHQRFVLCNSTNVEDIVAELARVTKPGGYVALQDYDVHSMFIHPPLPAWNRLYDLIVEVWVGDPFVGRRMPDLLRAAGIEDVQVDGHIRVWRPGDWFHRLSLYMTALLRERILASGLVSESELDSLLAEIEAHLDRPDSLTQNATLIQAWGRKPG